MEMDAILSGERFEFDLGADGFPEQLLNIPRPPERLYVIGNPNALVAGLAVIGARKATPYGLGCAHRFARIAAEKGACIISGGARGCDSQAHRAALEARGTTVAFLGGGCDKPYPACNIRLFQEIIDAGGAVASEQPWDCAPLPFMFRERNRLIAGLAQAVLIVEAGLPSGTFSTADEALDAGREVLAVPGAITSQTSQGANRLILQGATPVVDDESFEDALFRSLGMLKRPGLEVDPVEDIGSIVDAVRAQPCDMDSLIELAVARYGPDKARSELTRQIAVAETAGLIARQPDGRWGPAIRGDGAQLRC